MGCVYLNASKCYRLKCSGLRSICSRLCDLVQGLRMDLRVTAPSYEWIEGLGMGVTDETTDEPTET